MNRARKISVYSAAALVIGSFVCIVCGAASVVTYHMDNFRTGWNPGETTLTTANVNNAHFSQQAVALVDGQIDGQPLVLSNQNVNGTVYPTVVYVATENNSVYAVNGSTGAVLASVNLGASVAAPTIPPGTCHSNAPVIGISSTPVIDTSAGTLYVVTTISASGTIAHYLHALSTSTLADKMSLAIQSPAGITYSRQRSALTLFNGGVLIPFSSFCDNNRATTRGYLVYANLSVSPASQTDFQTSYYDLSSIWMSGSGPAVVGNNIYFSTGNGGTPYPPANQKSAGEPCETYRLDRGAT